MTDGPVNGIPLPGGVFVGPGLAQLGRSRWLAARRRRAAVRRPARTAFVFAGGGARGAAQVGMLDALVRRGIVPDALYGASVGAINAGGFAGDPTVEGVAHMADLWRAVTREDVFPQGRFPSPWRFFQQRESAFPNDGVRRIIRSGLRFERFEDSPVHLEVVATSLHDGRPRWFTSGEVEEPILASAALPAMFPPVTVDGERFIDGGVVDNVPVGRAIAEGAERIFVLLCGPRHYTPQPSRRPIEALLAAFFIAVHARFVRELQQLPAGVEVVVFTVDTEPVSRYDDFSGTHALIAAGRANAETVLDFWLRGGLGDTDPGIPPVAGPDEARGAEARGAGGQSAAV